MKQHSTIWQRLENVIHPRIAVMRSLPGLGDFLCVIPALRAFRAALPGAHIVLIGLPEVKQLIQRFDAYIDELILFPGFPGIPEVPFNPDRTRLFLEATQAYKFDLILQMHGNGSITNHFINQVPAEQKVGYYPTHGDCPNSTNFLPYPDELPELWRHLRLIEFLGISLQGTHLEFPILKEDWAAWNALAHSHSLAANYVCIHPGASLAERCWQSESFARIADELAVRGLQIVLTGTRAEVSVVQAVAEAMRFPVLNLVGRTSLGALAILLKGARLVICNDTGISHLADALQTKSVVIFSNSDPVRWAPLNRQLHRIVCTSSSERSRVNSTSTSSVITQVLAEAINLLEQDFAYVS